MPPPFHMRRRLVLSNDSVKRVLLVAGSLNVRGSVTYTLNLAKGLKMRDYAPLVLSRGGGMAPAFERAGIGVDTADNLGKPIYDLFAFRRYLKTLADRSFDLVHVQHRSMIRYGLRAARALKLPLVLTVHHFSEPGETLRLPGKYVLGVIAVSESIREDLVNNARIPRSLVRVVRTGIDIRAAEIFKAQKKRSVPPVVGTIGMLTRSKGNEYFLRAARDVLDRGHEAHFVVAGQGEENSRLRKLGKELDLTRNLTFVTDFSEHYEVLRALDIFINPSLREGLGITVLQAMACGVPTISSASGGIHSFVTDGETGLMVPQKDSSAIAMAIIRLIEDGEFADKITAGASKMVEQSFSLDLMMDEVLDFYNRVVQKWKESSRV